MLFSDGQDSSSISDAETLLDVARRSAPTVAMVLASTSTKRPASLQRNATKPGHGHRCGPGRSDRRRHRRLRRRHQSRRQPDVDVPAGPRAVSHHLRALLHAERRRPSGIPHPRGAREARESRSPRPARIRLAIAGLSPRYFRLAATLRRASVAGAAETRARARCRRGRSPRRMPAPLRPHGPDAGAGRRVSRGRDSSR